MLPVGRPSGEIAKDDNAMCWDGYLLGMVEKGVGTLCQVGDLQRMFWIEERLRTCVAAKMLG
jgi:hypothetical protein